MHEHFHAGHIESYNRAVETLCRDCGSRPPPDAEICPACGSARILRHKELHGLTLTHLDCDAFHATIEKRESGAGSSGSGGTTRRPRRRAERENPGRPCPRRGWRTPVRHGSGRRMGRFGGRVTESASITEA